jgi:hypothetical protein
VKYLVSVFMWMDDDAEVLPGRDGQPAARV